MSPKTQAKLIRLALLPLTAILLLASGCSSSTTTNGMQSSAGGGPVFIVGTDAPASIPSIVGVPIQIETIELTNGHDNLSQPPRDRNHRGLCALQRLARLCGYERCSAGNVHRRNDHAGNSDDQLPEHRVRPPTINNATATLSTSSVSITLPHSLTVKPNRRSAGGPAHRPRSGTVDRDERRRPKGTIDSNV